MAFDDICARSMRRRFTFFVHAASLALAVFLAGCATSSTKVPVGTLEPDKFMWERGTAALNDRKWFSAREFFEGLPDRVAHIAPTPSSGLAIHASAKATPKASCSRSTNSASSSRSTPRTGAPTTRTSSWR